MRARAVGKVRLFAHGLFGFARVSAPGSAALPQSSSASGLGLGVDCGVRPRVALRLGQFDYVITYFVSSNQIHTRYASGFVLRF